VKEKRCIVCKRIIYIELWSIRIRIQMGKAEEEKKRGQTRSEKRYENMRAMSISRRPNVSCVVVIVEALREATAHRVFLVCAREFK